MKQIGLIGGIGCLSTAIYYKTITRHITQRLGHGHTGYVIIYSIDEFDILGAMQRQEWDRVAQILITAGKSLERAGVDFLLICSNLFNKMEPIVRQSLSVPVIHILLPICEEINRSKFRKIGLIGTQG